MRLLMSQNCNEQVMLFAPISAFHNRHLTMNTAECLQRPDLDLRHVSLHLQTEAICWVLQDSAVATALGQKSYNELVEQLVMILGDATPKRLLTPQLSRRTSGYSTPRRTSSGLAAVGPSDLLSPTEIALSSRQTPDTQKAAAPPSIAADAEPDSSVQSASMDTPDTVAPTGAMTNTDVTHPTLSDAAQAGGPTGSLVSAQHPAAADDSFPSSAADSAAASQHSHGQRQNAQTAHHQQPQKPLLSPAAEMASRAYPLPAAPLEDGGLSTPQSSGKFDAHIATAPTPYPSLASELSQPGSPASSKGSTASMAAALKASLAPLGKGSAGSPIAANPAEGKSRFAPSSAGQAATSQADTSARDFSPAANAEDVQGTASSAAAAQAAISAAHNDNTTIPEQPTDSMQDLGLSDLKLDDADSEQLQLALAISLGQQEAEQAQEVAEQEVHAQTHTHQETAEPASACDNPSPVSQTDLKGATALESTSQAGTASEGANNAGSESSHSQAGALPATSVSQTSRDQDTEQHTIASDSGVAKVSASIQPASTQPKSSQPASASEPMQSTGSAQAQSAEHGALEDKQLDLLTAEAPSSHQQGQKEEQQSAQQPDKSVVAQQSDSKMPLVIAAGKHRPSLHPCIDLDHQAAALLVTLVWLHNAHSAMNAQELTCVARAS